MAMANMYTNPPWDYEKDRMREEIEELKDVINSLTIEMEEIKRLMSARASFTDFKVFKFNEEEEKRKEAERIAEEERIISREALSKLARMIR